MRHPPADPLVSGTETRYIHSRGLEMWRLLRLMLMSLLLPPRFHAAPERPRRDSSRTMTMVRGKSLQHHLLQDQRRAGVWLRTAWATAGTGPARLLCRILHLQRAATAGSFVDSRASV